MAQPMTIDFIDQVTRITNQRIADEMREAFGSKYKPPTLSPAQTRSVLEVAAELVPADAPDALTVVMTPGMIASLRAIQRYLHGRSATGLDLQVAVSVLDTLLAELEATE